MRRLTTALVMLAVLLSLSGCWKKRVKHLSDGEFDHYYALRPFMSEDQQKTFLKLKTEESRDQYLRSQEVGRSTLWDLFYQYDEAQREAIVAGEVEEGWTMDQVLMAWGAPWDKQRLVGRPAQRSELYIYRFEVQSDGRILIYYPGSKTAYNAVRRFHRKVFLDDNVVTGLEEQDGW